MSETAFFVKDMIGPEGAVSIVATEAAGDHAASADHAGHTRTGALRLHHAALKPTEASRAPTKSSPPPPSPSSGAVRSEQQLFLDAIRGSATFPPITKRR